MACSVGFSIALLIYALLLNFGSCNDLADFNSGYYANGLSNHYRTNYKHFGFGKAVLINMFLAHPDYNRDNKHKNKTTKRNVNAGKFILALCLLLSGDIHQCPGPANVTVDVNTNQADYGSNTAFPQVGMENTVSAGITCTCTDAVSLCCPGAVAEIGGEGRWIGRETGAGDSGAVTDDRVMRTEIHAGLPDQGGGAERSSEPSPGTCATEDRAEQTRSEQPTPAVPSQPARGETVTRQSTPQPISKIGKKPRNPILKRYRTSNIFKTLNQAKLIWDPKLKSNGLLCGHLNVRSLMHNHNQIEHMLCDSNIDIMGLSETWLTRSSPEAAVAMPGYSVFRQDRAEGRGGGVLLYLRNALKCSQLRIPDVVEIECVCVNVILSAEMSFVVICMYRPPSAKQVFYTQLHALLQHFSNKNEVIIIGDFNINWDIKSVRKPLKQTTDRFDYSQLIEQSTRITSKSSTRIDLLFTNKPERVVKTYNLLTGISDHNAIFFTRKLSSTRFSSSRIASNPAPYYECIPKNQQQNLASTLNTLNWAKVTVCEDADLACGLFNESIKEVVSSFTTRRKHRKGKDSSLPWVDAECRGLMLTRDLLLKKSLKSGLTTDRIRFTALRNKTTQTLRKAKANFFINIIKSAQGNGKLIWQNINKLVGRQGRQGEPKLELKINNIMISDPITLATSLNSFFLESVNDIAQRFPPPVCSNSPISSDLPAFRISEITEAEVARLIAGLKDSRAKDVYDLSTEFIKTHRDSLTSPITHLINLSISHSVVPSMWKVAAVTPVLKSGSKTDMANYRPISILPTVSKIAEKWVASLLVEHLNKGDTPLHPMQFGFRAHHSTETAMCAFTEKVKGLLDKNSCVSAVFLDLKKAFDTVDHRVLLSRLTSFNFSSDALLWFRSYLSNRRQLVTVADAKSSSLECNVGVPQGSVLGPILFSMFINTLPNICPNIYTQLYADDAVILTAARNPMEASFVLTSAMAVIQDWLTESCLLLNAKKTVCMVFTKRLQNVTHSGVFLNGEELDIVTEFNYLGVTLDSTLTFKSHIKKMSNSIKFNLQNFRHIRNNLTEDVARLFMVSMIFSRIEYCLTTWSLAGISSINVIASLYKRALKVFDKKPRSFHHCVILAKHKFLSFENMIHFKNACIIFKVLHGLAPPPLDAYIKRLNGSSTTRTTRASARGDCVIPYRRTVTGKSVLSVRGGNFWNGLPGELRECPTLSTFKVHLKEWLLSNQVCGHS